jgi:hypothetical protein
MCSPMAHEPLSSSLKPPDFGPIAPGAPGQGNYSAANAALDGHARYWKQVLQARSRQGEAVGDSPIDPIAIWGCPRPTAKGVLENGGTPISGCLFKKRKIRQ